MQSLFHLEVVGTPHHYLAEMNLLNLFALSGGGEQKCSFSARAIDTTCDPRAGP